MLCVHNKTECFRLRLSLELMRYFGHLSQKDEDLVLLDRQTDIVIFKLLTEPKT